MIPYNPHYGNYRTRTFSDIYPNSAEFIADRTKYASVIPADIVTDDDLEMIYILLLSKYADAHIASKNEQMFHVKMFVSVGSYAPGFLKNIEIQRELEKMALDSDDLLNATSSIVNHADHPATDPEMDYTEGLPYIDSQDTSNIRRGKMEAMMYLNGSVKRDLYSQFIERFEPLFQKIVIAQEPLYYVTDKEEN